MAQESEDRSDAAAGTRRQGAAAKPVIDLEAREIGADPHGDAAPADERGEATPPPAGTDPAPPPGDDGGPGEPSPGRRRASFLSRRGWSFGLGLVVLLMALVAGATWLHRRQTQSSVAEQSLAIQLAGLTQRLGALETAAAAAGAASAELRRSVDATKRQADAMQARLDDGVGRIAEVQKTLSALERTPSESSGRLAAAEAAAREAAQAVAELRSALAASGPRGEANSALASAQAQISALDRKLGEMAAELAGLRASAAAAASSRAANDAVGGAIAKLTAKAASGAPFGDELARLATLAPALPGLEVLTTHAAGAPSAADLRRRLAALPPAAAAASEPVPEKAAGLWPRFKAWFAGYVKVRRIVAPDWRLELARIQEAAARGDFAQAVALAEAAKAAPPELAPWIEAARARLAVDHALAQLAAQHTPQG